MAKAYQFDASGYFAGVAEDYGLLPNNATYTAPREREGHIPRWNGEAWVQVENHKGKSGYLDGRPYTVKDYGPLPEGFSLTPPPPTPEEAQAARIAEIDQRIATLEAAAQRPAIVIADIVSLAASMGRGYTDAELYTLDLEGSWLSEYRTEIEDLRSERAALE